MRADSRTTHDQHPPTHPANDDAPPPENAISFTDLCAALAEDDDAVLQRLAGILARRETDG